MKKFVKILFSFVFLLLVSFALVACGDDTGEKKVSKFEFENTYATIRYDQQLTNDPFGTKVVYTDGTSVKIDDLTQETAQGINVKITKFNPATNQDEEWESRLTVGSYTITYTYGESVKATATLYVEKIFRIF